MLFFYRQEELVADHVTYMKQHPELQAIVADFVQHLLIRRPNDVFKSAEEFFSTFNSCHPIKQSASKSSETLSD